VAEPGDRIGRYEVVRLIARGGIATVYEAYEPALDRSVALKQFELGGGDARRFVSEVSFSAALNHPNIVNVFDCFEVEGAAYVAAEYLPRGSLRPSVDRLTTAQVFGVVEGILAGLAHAERDGVVHGDLKPENVLIADAGRVKIADFGIARAVHPPAPEMAVGTPAYMAPEQAMAQTLGPYTDLYALGVMAYELLTGTLPFAAESPMALLYAHVAEPAPPLTGFGPGVAGWLAWLLEKDPEARPAGAREAWEELEPAVVDLLGPLWRRDATLEEEITADDELMLDELLTDDDAMFDEVSTDEFEPVVVEEPAMQPEPEPAPESEVVARAAGLQRMLRSAARRGIVAAPRPQPRPRPRRPPAKPAYTPPPPAPVVSAPTRSPQAPAEPEDMPGGGGGWRSVRLLLFAAIAGGVVYAILERVLGSTVPSFEPSSPPPDDVSCTVFAPPVVAPDESFLVQAFVHLPEHAEEARALALEMDTTAARRVFRSLDAPIPRGSRLHFELSAPGLQVDDPVASLVWRGHAEAVQFGVTVPVGATGTVIATVYMSLDSAPLGHVKFKLSIDTEAAVLAASPEPQGDDARRYRAAFISYASKDRDEVLERVQMLPLVGIRYFQDVFNLEPGDRWERRLEIGIDECDLFLLFWSGEAKASKWVRQEVGHALERRGSDDLADPEIKPVIIEGPPVIEPWAELAHLHFDDRVLYFMRR
jgi:serine/threonine protein kinase